jgi:hypothetical protein
MDIPYLNRDKELVRITARKIIQLILNRIVDDLDGFRSISSLRGKWEKIRDDNMSITENEELMKEMREIKDGS